MKIAWKWRRTIATEKTRRKPKKRTRSRYGAARRQLERISGGNERHLRNNSGGRYMHHGDHDDGAHKRGRETERDREKDTEREREREKEKKNEAALLVWAVAGSSEIDIPTGEFVGWQLLLFGIGVEIGRVRRVLDLKPTEGPLYFSH